MDWNDYDVVLSRRYAKTDDQTRVLICNRHESHVTADFIHHCREHNIVLLILSSHNSYLTQLLEFSNH